MTETQKQLVKDLVIRALSDDRTGKERMTRKQVKDAWAIIDWLGGAGEVVDHA